jgi:hypothetical protein
VSQRYSLYAALQIRVQWCFRCLMQASRNKIQYWHQSNGEPF